MKGYIYKYTYPNGKVYIGQTRRSVEERHSQHMRASKRDGCQICELAIRKYGEPTLETIEEIEVDDTNPTELVNKLNEAEERWIKHYDCTNDSGKGYNVQLGGEVVTPQEFILQEEWYRIFEEEGWGNQLGYIREVLEGIGQKMAQGKEKLTKEERKVWYGTKFYEKNWLDDDFYKYASYISNIEFRKIFKDKRNIEKINKEFLDAPKYTIYSFSSYYKKFGSIHSFADEIIGKAFEMYVECIRQQIWSKVMKRKDKVIKEFYKKK